MKCKNCRGQRIIDLNNDFVMLCCDVGYVVKQRIIVGEGHDTHEIVTSECPLSKV